jgi:UDP-N-acetylglucosamine acyltransferase
VVIEGDTRIGEGCEFYPFSSIGGAPQHSGHKPGDPSPIVIGARNIFREQTTVHGGSRFGRGVTTIGDDGQFYVGAHVGHDCLVGDHVVMTNNTALGGHVRLGDYVIMGGLSAVQQWGRVGRHAFVGGMAGANRDVIPFGTVWGSHATLEGLNLVGLKRRGFARQDIHALRNGFKELFHGEGSFDERLEAVGKAYAAAPLVMEVVDFIRAEPNRPLTMPASDSARRA